jgi:hypothetical protein
MAAEKKAGAGATQEPAAEKIAAPPAAAKRPALPPGVPVFFIPWRGPARPGTSLLYRPALMGTGRAHFVNAKSGIDRWESFTLLASLAEETAKSPWDEASPLEDGEPELEERGDAEARYGPLPPAAARPKSYAGWKKALASHVYRTRSMSLFSCAALKKTSEPGESEADFRIRLGQLSREKRDEKIEKLRKRFGAKAERLRDRIARAEASVTRESSQYQQQKVQTAISFGATLLGALMGRKRVSARSLGRATTTMRGVGRSAREKQDIGRARERVKALAGQLADLEQELQGALRIWSCGNG